MQIPNAFFRFSPPFSFLFCRSLSPLAWHQNAAAFALLRDRQILILLLLEFHTKEKEKKRKGAFIPNTQRRRKPRSKLVIIKAFWGPNKSSTGIVLERIRSFSCCLRNCPPCNGHKKRKSVYFGRGGRGPFPSKYSGKETLAGITRKVANIGCQM